MPSECGKGVVEGAAKCSTCSLLQELSSTDERLVNAGLIYSDLATMTGNTIHKLDSP